MNAQFSSESRIACGMQLKSAREARAMSLPQASAALHMPVRTLAMLEDGRWDELGAPVFVRGQLRSYARLLGLDGDRLLDEGALAAVRPVELVSHDHTPAWERFFNQLGSRLVYVVMTAAIAIPVYLVATRSLLPAGSAAAVAADATPLLPTAREPVTASLASLPKTQPAGSGFSFQFEGESWVQFYSPDGETLEKGLMKAGDRRDFGPGQLGRVVVGNAADVRIRQGGREVDTAAWQKSNVVRFAVSSDGSLLASH